MRVAIIADLHANLAALDAVLASLEEERVDRIVCLGDVAAAGPQPREVVARVREIGCPVVMGNGDAFVLDPRSTAAAGDAGKFEAIDRWCAEQLGPDDLLFLRSFRPTVEIPLEAGAHLLCYHGSPRGFDDVIAATTPEEELAPMLAGNRATVMAGGHWHFQMLRRFEEVVLVNPGSVGLAYDILSDGGARVPFRAEYAVLTSGGGALAVEFRRLPYDGAATVRAMFERGMPHAAWWAADWDL